MNVMYQEFRVWKRLNERSCIRYCCLRDLGTGRYAVQSADFFYLPIDEQQRHQLDAQFLELFMEINPQERCAWFDSVEAAIAAHDEEFA